MTRLSTQIACRDARSYSPAMPPGSRLQPQASSDSLQSAISSHCTSDCRQMIGSTKPVCASRVSAVPRCLPLASSVVIRNSAAPKLVCKRPNVQRRSISGVNSLKESTDASQAASPGAKAIQFQHAVRIARNVLCDVVQSLLFQLWMSTPSVTSQMQHLPSRTRGGWCSSSMRTTCAHSAAAVLEARHENNAMRCEEPCWYALDPSEKVHLLICSPTEPVSNCHWQHMRNGMQVAATHAWPEAGWDPAARPSPLMLGVLSGNVRLAVRALRDYAQALGFEFAIPQSRVRVENGSMVPCMACASACARRLPLPAQNDQACLHRLKAR